MCDAGIRAAGHAMWAPVAEPNTSPCRAAARFMEAEETRAAEALAQRATQAGPRGPTGPQHAPGRRARSARLRARIRLPQHALSAASCAPSYQVPRLAGPAHCASLPATCSARDVNLSALRFIARFVATPDCRAPGSNSDQLLWSYALVTDSVSWAPGIPYASLARLAARRGRPGRWVCARTTRARSR